MQHNVHGVVLRAAAGGGQSVCEQRGAAGLRGQAVLQPHVRGHPVGQAAPITAEPVRVVAPVERLRCDKTDVLADGSASLDKLCLQILFVCENDRAMVDPATPYRHIYQATAKKGHCNQ